MDIERYVGNVLFAARTIWVGVSIFSTVVAVNLIQGWWLFALLPYYLITYLLMLVLAARYLASAIPMEDMLRESRPEAAKAFAEIKRRIVDGTLEGSEDLYELMDAAGLSVTIVTEVSEKKVGRYFDKDLYEWVEVLNPATDEKLRFEFEQVAERNDDGDFVLPPIEEKLAVLFDGGVYTRQPE